MLTKLFFCQIYFTFIFSLVFIVADSIVDDLFELLMMIDYIVLSIFEFPFLKYVFFFSFFTIYFL